MPKLDAWPFLLAAIALLVFLVATRGRLSLPSPERFRRQRMERDAADPYKAWVQSAFLIVSGTCDYAHLARQEARRMLVDWWDVHGHPDVVRVLDDLGNAHRPDNAWDLVRFMVVARLAVGAGYLEEDESWALIRPIAVRLQAGYSSFKAVAQAYLQARRQWRGYALDGSEDDDEMRRIIDNIAQLSDTNWRAVPFETDLVVAANEP